MLAGGADIDPASYGAAARTRDASTRCPSATPSKSRSTRAAIERDLPVLGICRGMQLINVALRRHAAPAPARALRPRGAPARARLLRRRRPRRRCCAEGSLAARAAGEARARHQVPPPPGRRPPRRGAASSAAARRSTSSPEAIELPDRRFVLGVQWHPEADPASPVIGALGARRATPRSRAARQSRRLACSSRALTPALSARRRAPIYSAASAAVERRSEQPPGGWWPPGVAAPLAAQARAARPPVADAGGRLRRAARAVRRACRARARATWPCARCRCGPTWPRTSRRTTTPRAQAAAGARRLPDRRRPRARARRAADRAPAARARARRARRRRNGARSTACSCGRTGCGSWCRTARSLYMLAAPSRALPARGA